MFESSKGRHRMGRETPTSGLMNEEGDLLFESELPHSKYPECSAFPISIEAGLEDGTELN
jgi:hypothetical protein